MGIPREGSGTVSGIIRTALLVAIAAACLAPVLNTMAISLSDKTAAAVGKVSFWPVGFTLSPYREIWMDPEFFSAFLNSILRVILGGTINVGLAVLMAYPLSKSTRAFPSRNRYLWLLVFTMLFYGGLVPSFLLIRYLRLMDTIWALVLPTAVPAFSVIVLMNYFRTIPQSLEEAALVDGANPMYILVNIFVPLAKPAIAAIALFSIVHHWNSFFDGKIFIDTPSKRPLQTYIQSLSVQPNYNTMQYLQPEEIVRKLELSNLTFNSAKIVVSMIPILLIYPLLQRYFVTGIIMGSVKE